MKKHFILDTNVLLEAENVIEIVRNGKNGKDVNEIYIPRIVLDELDGLKKNSKLRHRVSSVVESLLNSEVSILNNIDSSRKPDDIILDEAIHFNMTHENKEVILITNDRMLQFKAKQNNVLCEEFKSGNPFQTESEKWTGFVEEGDTFIPNSFYWKDGKPFFWNGKESKIINYQHNIWKVEPRDIYQNLALELLTSEIPLITIQSEAGTGKTMLSLASALYLTLQKKIYSNIIIVKNNIEIGEKLGFLPGDVEEKMDPFILNCKKLLLKLHGMREANRLFFDPKAAIPMWNNQVIDFMPINYMRGMNIDNCVVIIDELQNFSNDECRTIFSRMGENVKCICTGDVKQVDNPHLNEINNGMNWTVKNFKGDERYAHLLLKSKKTRGPICDMVKDRWN